MSIYIYKCIYTCVLLLTYVSLSELVYIYICVCVHVCVSVYVDK